MIYQAAIKYPELGVVTLPRPARHHDIIRAVHEKHEISTKGSAVQGFITDTDEFVNRKIACQIAYGYNQIIKKHGPKDLLFSEDLW